ncbi:MAG: SDR family oxidoreductase [Bryobacteraceae bacterium]|nr:SDR family oxidoreductase [Bryobacteraceae bacterium]
MPDRLKDKVAIVTGAGSGIGKATAELFAREGASIVAADWNGQTGSQTAQGIHAAGGRALFTATDVSNAAAVRAMIELTMREFGRLDVLVNNAAVQILGKLADTSEHDWDRIHSVNLKGVFLCTKYAIPAMIASGGGSIVNMASILGFVGDPDLAAYCAAKGGVIALTKATALGYGPAGIRVNCICPGDVDTPMVREYFDKDPHPDRLRQEIYGKYALRRIATPREIAEAALYLASDASAFVTATSLVVDGGLTSKCY